MVTERHLAARIEDTWNGVLSAAADRRGWHHAVLPYAGYGNHEMLRILARVIRVPHEPGSSRRPVESAPTTTPPEGVSASPPSEANGAAAPTQVRDPRGWRAFFAVVGAGVEVTVRVPDGEPARSGVDDGQTVLTDRSGYLDVRIPNPGLGPGWQRVTLQIGDGARAVATILVVSADQEFGLISDIDDTVIRTLLPRPMLAAYNTFILRERSRRPVNGMAQLYRKLLAPHPGAPTIYVSTGAWNTAGTLRRFLARNGYPEGPMLLTDWGPTNSGWFRSGRAHKRACLETLVHDFPNIRWVLVGDDGQHDPSLYADFAGRYPDRVRVIAIRQLSPHEQVLAHGTAVERMGQDSASVPIVVPEVRGEDGEALSGCLAAYQQALS